VKSYLRLIFVLTLQIAWALPIHAASSKLNGFDLRGALIPAKDIHRGGPPRDGIPALTDPRFVTASKSGLTGRDRVLGVFLGGIAKAYPIRILNWHEIVNDALGGQRIAVTYCPLCGTAMVFASEAAGRRRSFGVSGLLYNSDVLLYDRESGSLWSQVMKQAVSGPVKGAPLQQIPARHTTWAKWRKEHPQTTVLSFNTGHRRDYERDPYAGYASNEAVFFPVPDDARLPRKEWVLGLSVNGVSKAYVLSDCPETFSDTFDKTQVVVHCDRAERSAYAVDSEGTEYPSVQAYWFAWAAFHPDTEIVRMAKK
jgi:hypothetical protein